MNKIIIALITTSGILFCMNPVHAKDIFVEIYKKQFIPSEIIIEQGDTVIWKNIEKRQYHNVWFKQLQTEEPDYFFPDETYQKTFDKIGGFAYECGPHPKMKGNIVVVIPTQ